MRSLNALIKKSTYSVHCYGDIDDKFIRSLSELSTTLINRKHSIVLFMSSGGGSTELIYPAIHLLESLQEKHDVTIINTGIIGSAALDIFMTVHKRTALKQTTFVLHKSSMTLEHPHDVEYIDEYINRIAFIDKLLYKRCYKNVVLTERQTSLYNTYRDVFVYEPQALKQKFITFRLKP